MSIKPVSQADPWDIVPGVVDEPRDGRTYSEVVLPFVARTDGFVLQGTKFSIGGFELLREGTDVINGDQVVLDHKSFALRDQPFQLRINLSGFVLELAIRASFVGTEGDGEDQRLLFAITQISAREEQALRRIIRAYLNGQIANADDVVRAMDDPTGAGKKPASNAAPAPAQSNWKPRIIAGFASVICALILAVSLISLFDRFMITRSAFASVTAPKLDILSPGVGRIELLSGGAGHAVSRDDPLFVVRNAELEGAIELSRAKLAFLEASLDRTLKIGNVRDISALDAPQIEAVQGLGPDARSIELVEDEISLEAGRLSALELRAAGLTQHAPCDCVISWSVEHGAWQPEGEPLMTLAKTGQDDLRIEALIHLDFAKDMHVGQSAFVRFAGERRLVPAIVESIMLDGQIRPRTGFPLWLRKDHSLGSVTFFVEERLEPSMIGVPTDVFVTDRLPLMETVRKLAGF